MSNLSLIMLSVLNRLTFNVDGLELCLPKPKILVLGLFFGFLAGVPVVAGDGYDAAFLVNT